MLTDIQVQEIRSRFSIFARKIYLNSCSQGALSDAVQAGLENYIASWHEQGSPWELWVEQYEAARTAFAQFINASPDEVVVVTSASAGINSIASALNFRERKKVVMGEFEFPTMGHVWLAQRARGAEVQFVSAEGNRITKKSSTAIRSSCRSRMYVSKMAFVPK
jgi:selenocysteine lyase/cysteine desulfurase